VNRRKTKLGAAAGTVAAALGVTFTAWTLAQAATSLPSGNENTSIIVQNVGNAPADFIVDYYLPNGTRLDASDSQFDVPVGGTRNFAQAINSELGAGYRGVGVVSSDQPINALLVRDVLNTAATGNHSYSIVNAQATGGPKLALPILLDEFSSDQYNSRASVVNTGTETACVKITYFVTATLSATPVGQAVVDAPTGQAGCTTGYSLAAGGQLTFGRAGTGTIQFPAATRNTQSAALIEVVNSTANNEIAASVDLYRSDGNRLLGSYNGFIVDDSAPATDDVGTDVVVPLAIKHSSGYYSVIGVQNLDGAAANVQIRYVGATEGGTPVDTTVTLPNVTNAGFHSTYEASAAGIPVDFVGYARVTSTAKVAALLVRGKETVMGSGVNEPIYTAVNGVPADQADTEWNLPLIFRRFAQTFPGSIGYNSWIQVQVADGSTASVTLRFVGDPASGCPVGPYTTTVNVTGSKVFYMNANNDNGFPAGGAPSCFWGGAQVTANKGIIVIANVSSDSYPDGDNEGLYNGFKQ
jgi:hypothetical protein